MNSCRHGRDILCCEQCKWEIREASKRFDQHVADNLRLQREAIERSPYWQRMLQEALDGRDVRPNPYSAKCSQGSP